MRKADLATFFQIINEIENSYAQLAKNFGISYNELAIFHMLYKHAPCTQKQIAEKWRLPKQTVNNYCKVLLEKGLLCTVESRDKREKQLCFTPQGEVQTRAVLEKLEQVEQETLTQFGKKPFEELVTLIRAYQRCFEQVLEI